MTRARLFSQSGGGANSNATISAILPSLTTANIAEIGANLYFSNARVFANIRLASINDLLDVDTANGKISGATLVWTGSLWAPGNVSAVANLSLSNTDSLVEGVTNKYFTNARARTAFTAYDNTIVVDWNTGTIRANVVAIANAASTADAVLEGSVNKYFTNARVYANLELASIDVFKDVDFTYATPSNNKVLVFREDFGNVWIATDYSFGSAFFAETAQQANVVLGLNNLSTDDLREGANNKYLTVSVLNNFLANISIDKLLDVNTQSNLAVSRVLAWNGTQWVPQAVSDLANVVASITSSSSFANTSGVANVALVANFANTATSANIAFFANTAGNAIVAQRANFANTAGTSNVALVANIANLVVTLSNFTTANLIESSSNLYFTNARVISVVTPLLTTANLIEGVNKYFTNARVLDALVTSNVIIGNLVVNNDLTVQGNLVTLAVSNVQIESRTITLAKDAATAASAEGAGILINGANARLTYSQGSDALTLNKDLLIRGNIIPSVSGVYNLGSQTNKFLSLYLGTQTLFIGNISLGESPTGGLDVKTPSGEPSDGSFANLTSTEGLVVNRLKNNTFPTVEINPIFGGNVLQFTGNVTGNIYYGIKKDGLFDQFSGMRVVRTRVDAANVRSDVIIYTEQDNKTNSTARVSILGNGNINILANIYLDRSSRFDGNVTGDLIGNVTGTVSTLFNHTTDGLREGTGANLYFTNNRVLVGVTTGLVQGNITVSDTLFSNSLFTGNASVNNLTVNGDLIVQGNTVTLNTATLQVEDKNIVLASGATNSATADGAGINIAGANANLTYVSASDKFVFNKNVDVSGSSIASGFYSNTLNTNTVTTNVLVSDTNSIAINSNVTIQGNAIVLGNFTARANGSLTLGTPRLGTLISNAISMSTETTVSDGISQLNQILGKLVPASPRPLTEASGNLSIIGVASYRICNFTQTINGPTATQAAAGSTVTTVLRSNTWTSTWINDVGPGDSGTVTVYLNGNATGSKALGAGSDNGTYSNLTITDNVDYGTKTGQATGFWESMDLRANATTSSPGWNEVYIQHSQAGQSNVAYWYNDINSPGTPTLTSNIFGPTSNSLTYSSTVPHYNSSTAWNIRVNVNKLSGDFYHSSDTFITGSAGGAFSTPTSITYTSAGITTPLINNLYRDGGSIQVSTAVNIASGFGRTLGTGPSLTVQNGYTSGSASIVPIGNVLYKTGTSSAMEETAITVGSAFGTGSTTVSRIENPGNGNTPVHTASATLFNSTSSTLQTYDATTVGAILKHDTTNYSEGYWPAGPNLTTQANVQYFTFRAVRTSLSKFNIKYTGNIAGMWCSMPGSVIDTTSTANGWLDMNIAYAGAGVPGAGVGGNGSQGCSLGGTVSLNTQVSASSKTCTFGTVSTSSTGTNEVYVRIKLTPGQTVTALSLETASN